MNLLSDYKIITVTHHNLDLNEIGSFYVHRENDNQLRTILAGGCSRFGFEECMYLETCNRVSYILVGDTHIDEAFLKAFFTMVNPSLGAEVLAKIEKYVTVYEAENAVRHIFELASSMDSLVVGEREIFRQFRAAYASCRDMGLCGDRMRLLEKAAVRTAKEVYHKTGIGEKALSVVSLAMQEIRKKKLDKSSRILLVGSGETNTLVGKFLKKYRYDSITIYNRSLDNARDLSRSLQADACHISELENINGRFDVIFICTAANKVIIDLPLYRKMLGQEKSKKIIVDLAVPRNIDPAVPANYDVDYIDIESLRTLSEANLQHRHQEMLKARPIIADNLRKFVRMFHQRNLENTLSHIPVEIRSIKHRAMDLVYRERVEQLDPEYRELLEEMMAYMEKKCISVPMRLAREGVRTDQRI